MTELPGATTVAVVPDKDITDVVPDVYVNVPGVEGVGSVNVKLASPLFLATFDHEKVGVTFANGFSAEYVIPLFVKYDPAFKFPDAS
jgi:hypothetical protein